MLSKIGKLNASISHGKRILNKARNSISSRKSSSNLISNSNRQINSSNVSKTFLESDSLFSKQEQKHFISTTPTLNTTTTTTTRPQTPNDPVAESRGDLRRKLNLKVGDELHGYTVTKVTEVPERGLVCYNLIHQKSGARHLHVDCNDTNNTFSVTFKTIPQSSNGVAHILEHTTLCGSNKYPVRDPFFNMIDRSLNTFMNAWTGPDYTSYPFSSENQTDFANLLSVYLDATFYPLLREIDFKQEGHRLELSKQADGAEKLEFKGVVFNEMKGSMSDPSNLFGHRVIESIFPDTPYAHNSGGEPKDILNLTYEQLKEFHRVHYHPSNSFFYTYGDMPLENHLRMISENYLNNFTKQKMEPTVPSQPLFSTPKHLEFSGPLPPVPGQPDKQSKLLVASMANPIVGDYFETFSLSILSNLLLGGPNAPMHKSLIDSNIGSDYAAGTGYDAHTKQGVFGIGLQNISKSDYEKVQNIIDETIRQAIETGFEEERIQSIIHQLELSQKHKTTSFGLSILGAITHVWIHGGDPIAMLFTDKWIKRLQEERKNGLFENLMKKYLLDNKHKVVVTMHPDEQYQQKLQDEEQANLKEIEKKLTETQKTEIRKMGEALKEHQNKKPDVSCLPAIKLNDISKIARVNPVLVEISESNYETAYYCQQQTNDITYLRATMQLPPIPKRLVPYVPLFTSLLTSMGAAELDHRQLSQEIELYTGGISFGADFYHANADPNNAECTISMFGMAFRRNLDKLLELITKIITQPNFTNLELLQTLINARASDYSDSLISDGTSFAKSIAASTLRADSYLSENWSGLTQGYFLKDLAMNPDQLQQVADDLKLLASLLLNGKWFRYLLTDSEFTQSKPKVQQFFRNMSVQNSNLNSVVGANLIDRVKLPTNQSELKNTFITVPASSVNFVARTIPLNLSYSHPDAAKMTILSRLLTSKYLLKEVREKGGAYGSSSGARGGLISFTSYRDPHVERTLETFANAQKWVNTNNFVTDEDLDQAKVRTLADMDSPVAPSDRGLAFFSLDITPRMKQRKRDQIFSVSKKDLVEVANKYLSNKNERVAVVGSETKANELKANNEKWNVISTSEDTPISTENYYVELD